MALTVQSDSPYCLHLLQCSAVLYTEPLPTALVLNYHSSYFLNKCLVPILPAGLLAQKITVHFAAKPTLFWSLAHL